MNRLFNCKMGEKQNADQHKPSKTKPFSWSKFSLSLSSAVSDKLLATSTPEAPQAQKRRQWKDKYVFYSPKSKESLRVPLLGLLNEKEVPANICEKEDMIGEAAKESSVNVMLHENVVTEVMNIEQEICEQNKQQGPTTHSLPSYGELSRSYASSSNEQRFEIPWMSTPGLPHFLQMSSQVRNQNHHNNSAEPFTAIHHHNLQSILLLPPVGLSRRNLKSLIGQNRYLPKMEAPNLPQTSTLANHESVFCESQVLSSVEFVREFRKAEPSVPMNVNPGSGPSNSHNEDKHAISSISSKDQNSLLSSAETADEVSHSQERSAGIEICFNYDQKHCHSTVCRETQNWKLSLESGCPEPEQLSLAIEICLSPEIPRFSSPKSFSEKLSKSSSWSPLSHSSSPQRYLESGRPSSTSQSRDGY